MADLNVALVHDYLLTMRGAERSFAEIGRCWPDAPIFTSIFDESSVGPWFAGHEIHTSRLQRMGVRQDGFRRLLPLFPRTFERFPVSEFDVVVSSSSAFAHGVIPRADALHVCYCYSPFRYAWHERELAFSEVPRVARPALNHTLERIRRWDVEASNRVDHYIAISKITQDRIRDSYGRDASVVYPPVDVERFGTPQDPDDYFMFVGEIVSHKRVEVAIEAVRRAGRHIKLVGTGPDRERLAAMYGDTVDFVGRISDEELNDLYARAQALIVPNVEEFGIAAVEAQAAGRPVVAIDRGGTSETVVDGVTGVLVPNGTIDEIAEAISQTDFDGFKPDTMKENAARFSSASFRKAIMGEVVRQLA